MIYNRTEEDVKNALEIRKNVIQQGQEPTDEQREILERGMLTINTLNRIENKQSELSKLILSMGYRHKKIINKEWSVDDIFFDADLERIINNSKILKDAFFSYFDTPQPPQAEYYYTTFNDLEKILADIESLKGDVLKFYNFCGTIECGEI